MPILTLTGACLAYGHHALLDHAEFMVDCGERVGLIGRNGSGKSSLLRILTGETPMDDGVLWRAPGLRMGHVPQEPLMNDQDTVWQVVSEGLGLENEGWVPEHKVDAVLGQLGLSPDVRVGALSGGWKKRVALARALVGEPELLILDEPTNHLDVDSILWLEELLVAFQGSLVFVTHDRRFLDRVATCIVELDRGILTGFGASFSEYQRRKVEQLTAESAAQARFDKFLAQEEVWIRKGVEARRTRNEGRVRRLESLREQRAVRRERLGQVQMALEEGGRSGELVAELSHVSLRYEDQTLVQDYSTRIMRGDKVGVMGPNGAGKTSLLKMILGDLPPDTGHVRLGTRLSVAYFDQLREQLDPEATLAQTISLGGDFVEINGTRKHVVGYLGDFLFPPERVRAKVKSLSGGERNRLLLARLFTRPANVLVLDEPTNDLDMDTLELLEELLAEYNGTLFLVSHDRAFLDQVVTQVIVLDGKGGVTENAGGYSDWMRYCEGQKAVSEPEIKMASSSASGKDNRVRQRPEKMSFKEMKELEELPGLIESLESRHAVLTDQLADPGLYKSGMDRARELQASCQAVERELEEAMSRWEALEQKQARLKGNTV